MTPSPWRQHARLIDAAEQVRDHWFAAPHLDGTVVRESTARFVVTGRSS
jgi:hypothetical protein